MCKITNCILNEELDRKQESAFKTMTGSGYDNIYLTTIIYTTK